MAARLGHVLYWLCLAVAGLCGSGWYLLNMDVRPPHASLNGFEWITLGVAVGVPWAIGRAWLYILAGE
jgi:hypothetical protein